MNYRVFLLLTAFVTGLFYSSHAQQADVPLKPVSFDSIPRVDSMTNPQVAELALSLWARGRNMLRECQDNAAKVVAERVALDSLILAAKKDSSITKAQVTEWTNRLKEARKNEKTTAKLLKQTEKVVDAAYKVAGSDTLLQRKQAGKLWQDLKKMDLTLHPSPPPPQPEPVAAPEEPAKKLNEAPVAPPDTLGTVAVKVEKPVKPSKTKSKLPEKPGARFKPYDPATDVMLNPPQQPSTLAFNVRDEFSGEVRKEAAKSILFQFTNPVLRKYMQGKPHITCEAALGTAGANLTLTLTYTINDANARKAFGGVGKNAVLILKMIDGTTFTGYNLRPEEGAFDPGGTTVTYRPQYTFERTILRKLKTSEIDKVRMAWNTGYEDYEVQQIDLLMRQAKLLE
jgi:hypothetical protein